MAGKPGRSGGARAGSGRKPKESPCAPPPAAPRDDDDPVEFLIGVMNDVEQPINARVRAAVAAAQYRAVKLHDGGKKDAAKDAAKAAGTGRFATAAPPKLVVNNES